LKFIYFIIEQNIFLPISIFFVLYLLIILYLALVYSIRTTVVIGASRDRVYCYGGRVSSFERNYLGNRFANFIIIN
jgi:hypothetical protein